MKHIVSFEFRVHSTSKRNLVRGQKGISHWWGRGDEHPRAWRRDPDRETKKKTRVKILGKSQSKRAARDSAKIPVAGMLAHVWFGVYFYPICPPGEPIMVIGLGFRV
jgi:hypothetical protein